MRSRINRWLLCSALGSSGMFLFAGLAFGVLPAFTIPWLLIGNNLLVTDLVVGQLGLLSGWLWYECNGFTAFTQCKTNGTPNVAGQPAAQQPLKVLLKPTDKRSNPDPARFEEDIPNRDVKPKATIASPDKPAQAMPTTGTWNTFLDTFGAPVSLQLSQVGSNYYRDIKTLVAPAGTNTPGGYNSLPSADAEGRNKVHWRTTPGDTTTIQVVYDKSVPITCPNGYTGPVGGNCSLQNAAAVKKPVTTTCEVLYANGAFNFDAANPNCDGLAAKLQTNASAPNQIRTISKDLAGETQGWTFEPNGQGGITICQDKGSGSSMTCINTGPYDSAQDGYPITGSQQYPGGSAIGGNAPTPISSSTSTGSGTGECYGYGCTKESTQLQVLSGVNKITDSATQAEFASIDSDPNVDAANSIAAIQSQLKQPSDYSGITTHITQNLGLPAGGQCSNAVFSFALFGRPIDVDFRWMCTPIAPIVNWFFWMLVTLFAISEVLSILSGRGLLGDKHTQFVEH